jgi:hypothetical protein
VVDVAHVDASLAGPLAASHQAHPPEHRVIGRDTDHLGAQQRVKGRAADQRGQQLQPVPPGPATVLSLVERYQRARLHRA